MAVPEHTGSGAPDNERRSERMVRMATGSGMTQSGGPGDAVGEMRAAVVKRGIHRTDDGELPGDPASP